MRSRSHGTSQPPRSIPDNAFAAEFLERFGERDEPITAAEAEYAGPWWTRPVPDRPGAVAVLRRWEDVEQGDVPEAVFLQVERALLTSALLPALDREPFFHLAAEPGPEGYALTAVYGEQGPQVAGWVRRYEPRLAEALHLLESVVRSPAALALVLVAAGPGAIEQAGRILARELN
jgi:hypothetical protein